MNQWLNDMQMWVAVQCIALAQLTVNWMLFRTMRRWGREENGGATWTA